MTAEQHWKSIRDKLSAKRAALAAEGRIVVSSEISFPPDTDLSYRRADLSSFSTAELKAELARREH